VILQGIIFLGGRHPMLLLQLSLEARGDLNDVFYAAHGLCLRVFPLLLFGARNFFRVPNANRYSLRPFVQDLSLLVRFGEMVPRMLHDIAQGIDLDIAGQAKGHIFYWRPFELL